MAYRKRRKGRGYRTRRAAKARLNPNRNVRQPGGGGRVGRRL